MDITVHRGRISTMERSRSGPVGMNVYPSGIAFDNGKATGVFAAADCFHSILWKAAQSKEEVELHLFTKNKDWVSLIAFKAGQGPLYAVPAPVVSSQARNGALATQFMALVGLLFCIFPGLFIYGSCRHNWASISAADMVANYIKRLPDATHIHPDDVRVPLA